jgi:hypothetical protein
MHLTSKGFFYFPLILSKAAFPLIQFTCSHTSMTHRAGAGMPPLLTMSESLGTRFVFVAGVVEQPQVKQN